MPDQVVRVDPFMLRSVLAHVRRAQPIGLVARTIPAMTKTENPYWLPDAGVFDCVRIRQLTGFVSFDYARTVNTQRKREHREQNFESAGRSWGRNVYEIEPSPEEMRAARPTKRTPLVRYRGRWYLNLKRQTICRTEHRRLTTNEIISDETLLPFLRADDGRFERRRQEVDRPVIVRDYALQHIARLTLAGTLYLVDPCPHRSLSDQVPAAA